jgi:Ser/Thr protein kinase RdoA (MazF antagonist)
LSVTSTAPAAIDEVTSVLSEYGLEIERAPTPVAGGTLNWNYRAESQRGPFFVRLHRRDVSLERVLGEHALLRWVQGHGVPVVPPLPTHAGSTVVTREDRLWAVFPWASGTPPRRGNITSGEAFAIGACHGKTHAVLQSHPLNREPVHAPVFEAPLAAGRLRHLGRLAAERNEERLRDDIQFQLRLLEEHGVERFSFASLSHCLSHGDFHDQQVLLTESGSISAVLDWEMFGPRPRALEVIRSLSFSLLLGDPAMESYLAGYRRHCRLPADECEAVVELWWQQRLQTSWAFGAYLEEGNDRLAAFFPSMRSELERLSDPRWRSSLAARMAGGT